MLKTRAKMQLCRVERWANGEWGHFQVVYGDSPENKLWAAASPHGSAKLPLPIGGDARFLIGAEFFVDFELALDALPELDAGAIAFDVHCTDRNETTHGHYGAKAGERIGMTTLVAKGGGPSSVEFELGIGNPAAWSAFVIGNPYRLSIRRAT